jgi:hypothetical protein
MFLFLSCPELHFPNEQRFLIWNGNRPLWTLLIFTVSKGQFIKQVRSPAQPAQPPVALAAKLGEELGASNYTGTK